MPSPSLPNITAKRLHEEWMRRAQALQAKLPDAPVERALEALGLWSEQVTGSAADAYSWEVQYQVDKRVLRPEMLASDTSAARVFVEPVPGVSATAGSSGMPLLYKVFVNRAQQGPYTLAELAQRIALREVDAATKVWNMQWVPRVDQWKLASEIPEIVPLLGAAIPDPDDGIPDPE
jgi:hypothetical protein